MNISIYQYINILVKTRQYPLAVIEKELGPKRKTIGNQGHKFNLELLLVIEKKLGT